MPDNEIVFKRAAFGQVAFAIWYFGFFGIDPLEVNSTIVQVAYLAIAGLLTIGSIPRSFVHRAFDSAAKRSGQRLSLLFAIGVPILVILAFGRLAAGSYQIYSVGQDAMGVWRLVFDAGVLVLELIGLIVNLATIAVTRRAQSTINLER